MAYQCPNDFSEDSAVVCCPSDDGHISGCCTVSGLLSDHPWLWILMIAVMIVIMIVMISCCYCCVHICCENRIIRSDYVAL